MVSDNKCFIKQNQFSNVTLPIFVLIVNLPNSLTVHSMDRIAQAHSVCDIIKKYKPEPVLRHLSSKAGRSPFIFYKLYILSAEVSTND